MAGDDMEGGAIIPVSHRNTGIGKGRHSGGDKIAKEAGRIGKVGNQRQDVENAVKEAYAIVTATGVPGAVQKSCSPKVVISSNAILANMGVEDEFGPDSPAERVLNGKATINFSLEEPTHLRYIETTFALQNAGLEWLIVHPDAHGIVTPPDTLEEQLLDIVRKEGSIGPELKLIGL